MTPKYRTHFLNKTLKKSKRKKIYGHNTLIRHNRYVFVDLKNNREKSREQKKREKD